MHLVYHILGKYKYNVENMIDTLMAMYTYTSNCCDTARLVPDFNDSLSAFGLPQAGLPPSPVG